MLYPFDGSFELPVWRLTFPTGDFTIEPTENYPGGPALFTSREQAARFLVYHRSRWGELGGAEICASGFSLGELVRRWRASYAGIGRTPDRFTAFLIDPREPFGLHGAFDAEVIPFSGSYSGYSTHASEGAA